MEFFGGKMVIVQHVSKYAINVLVVQKYEVCSEGGHSTCIL